MNDRIRRALDMAARVRDFVLSHPDANSGYTSAATQLDGLITRAEALAQQEVAGRRTVAGAVVNKVQLRQEIYETIALVAGLAGPASREAPELAVGIARPSLAASHQEFLALARTAATIAATHRDLLARYGMPEPFIGGLGGMLDRFEAALSEKHAGQAAHVGARAELKAVTAEIMQLVQQLDALNRFRFRNDAESLGAWRSARNVAWPANDRVAGAPINAKVKPAA
jgi:hypothetical protein